MKDENYMKLAIEEARKATWPFGAVLVRGGNAVSVAGSGDENDPTAHAEVNVIRIASSKIGSPDLSGSTLYASCEPCVMCFGAAWYAGIREIVFGSSIADIKNYEDSWGGDLAFPSDYIDQTGMLMHGGVLKDKVMSLYEEFNSKIH